ncbi:MAG: BamA/TamA family outer membrane protein [Oligoflexia bacterium]|nr:BamA/TamA family outer membrane protein [Oligoflexia bacterium]
MLFIDGDVLTRPLIIEAEENLRKLNLFSSVTISPIDRPGSNSVKDILVLIKEASPGSFQITPGFRNDLGLRLGFEVAYQNLGGWNRTVNARAVFNRRMDNNGYRFPEYNFSIGFKEPYLANWPVVFTSNLNVIKRQYSGFDAKVNRVSVGLRREFSKYLSGFLEYSYERVEIFNPQGDSYASYVGTDIIGSMTPGIIIDSRNDKYNPSTGFYSINRFEWASKYFGSRRNVDFYRTTSNNSAYFPIPGGIVFAAAVNMGWERSNIRDIEIPPFKLFRLGGIGSIRGYGEDSIEVETNKTIFGVLGSLNYRAEFRIPISGSLGSAIFLDAGNLMVDRFSFEPRKLRSSAGAGLRYITPVGPVALDFAWKLQGDGVVGDTRESAGVSGGASVDRFKIHFSIGSF